MQKKANQSERFTTSTAYFAVRMHVFLSVRAYTLFRRRKNVYKFQIRRVVTAIGSLRKLRIANVICSIALYAAIQQKV